MVLDRKVAAATHCITAWYLRTKLKPDSPSASLVADFDDDGEAHAGGRLLHLLTLSAIEGVAVMVRLGRFKRAILYWFESTTILCRYASK